MVNFRFHLVSLTAVFLALAIGIGVGATVVDRASVDFLQQRLDDIERRRAATNRENDRLTAETGDWQSFAEQAGDQLVSRDLEGVPVIMVAVEGVDAAPVASLHNSLARAGATDQGIVWLSGRLKLESDGDVKALAESLGVPESRPASLLAALIPRLAAQLTAGAEPGLLPALRERGLVRYEGGDLGTVPSPLTRVVLVSGADSRVANSDLAVRLGSALASAAAGMTVAVEAVPGEGQEDNPFVLALRQDSKLRGRMSTVDNLDDWRGRVATVLAIGALTRGVTGHFGVAEGSDRMLPEPPRP